MRKLAFTLTEILITLGIIGVMMALSISIIKPREIHYKYQYQQAQKTLSEAMREAVLRTDYTDHRFPKATYDSNVPVLQLCKGINETMNTTRKTKDVNLATSAIDGKNNVCEITALNGMKFYLWAPSDDNGKPVCRAHNILKKNDDGTVYKNTSGATSVIATVPVTSFVAFVDIDGNGTYYSTKKDHPSGSIGDISMGNLIPFWLDEDYQARPVLNYSKVTSTSCNF